MLRLNLTGTTVNSRICWNINDHRLIEVVVVVVDRQLHGKLEKNVLKVLDEYSCRIPFKYFGTWRYEMMSV